MKYDLKYLKIQVGYIINSGIQYRQMVQDYFKLVWESVMIDTRGEDEKRFIISTWIPRLPCMNG